MLTEVLRFPNNPDIPPVLNNRAHDIQYGNYIIGSTNDPHWKMYPKSQFYTAPAAAASVYAFTDYVVDANHFAFYMPESSGPTFTYSTLLRDHFALIRRQIFQYAEDAKRADKKDMAERKIQINKLINEQTNLLKQYENQLKTLTRARDKNIRSIAGRGNRTAEAMARAAAIVDTQNPLYSQTMNSANIITDNIQRYKNELKNYM